MFGGLAFLVQGNMAVAASSKGGLMVRLAADEPRADLLRGPGVNAVEMKGRVMKNWVDVDPAALEDGDALGEWVARGLAAVRELPPK